jgi:hypothetical protein
VSRGRSPLAAVKAANPKIEMKQRARTFRLQVDVPSDEAHAIDDFWFRERLPSKAAAIRELLRRGIAKDREENHSG